MDKPVHVPQLVKRFFRESGMEESLIGWEPVHFILKTVIGDYADLAVELRLPEHEGKDGNTEIITCHGEHQRLAFIRLANGLIQGREVRDDAGGIILKPLFIEKQADIDVHFPKKNVSSQCLPQRAAQGGDNATVRTPKGEKKNRVHGERFRPYFSIL